MFIFKVIHFIFERSKTVENKKEQNYLLRYESKFNSNKIFNLSRHAVAPRRQVLKRKVGLNLQRKYLISD